MPKYPKEVEGKKFLQQRYACRVEEIPAARPRIRQDRRRGTIKGVCSVSENPARFSTTQYWNSVLFASVMYSPGVIRFAALSSTKLRVLPRSSYELNFLTATPSKRSTFVRAPRCQLRIRQTNFNAKSEHQPDYSA